MWEDDLRLGSFRLVSALPLPLSSLCLIRVEQYIQVEGRGISRQRNCRYQGIIWAIQVCVDRPQGYIDAGRTITPLGPSLFTNRRVSTVLANVSSVLVL